MTTPAMRVPGGTVRAWTARIPRGWQAFGVVAMAVLAVVGLALSARLTSDEPVVYDDIEEHFKYGSTGGERSSGIPYAIFDILPELFAHRLPEVGALPERGWERFGLLYEEGRELPIGFSKRNVQGMDRVFLNCAVCHVGAVRETPESEPMIYAGMPSNTVDLGAFQRFLTDVAIDESFAVESMMPRLEDDWLNRLLLRLTGIRLMRERLLTTRDRFRYLDWVPEFGPGRVDTFSPAKALLNFPMERIPTDEWGGAVDFPSIWLQRKKRGMQLHWDGNNTKVEERNRSAAFGTGAFPPTLDRELIGRVEDWLLDLRPPPYPFAIDSERAARGAGLYRTYCAECHGKNGDDFSGAKVGTVEPICPPAEAPLMADAMVVGATDAAAQTREDGCIDTDRRRLDSYSYELSAMQNTLYAGYGDERFSHFRKTNGYANLPLDGIWLRAPYLHNGSVPTLRDLLEVPENRPRTFYRGYTVYDQERLGFVADLASFDGEGRALADEGSPRRYFLFDTGELGNGNGGHLYGTQLSAAEKDDLVEYLKTFNTANTAEVEP